MTWLTVAFGVFMAHVFAALFWVAAVAVLIGGYIVYDLIDGWRRKRRLGR